jgi:hypothetical protein
VRIAPPYTEWNQVATLPYGLVMYDLDVSPDGSRLSASFGEISGKQNVRVLDVARVRTGDLTAVTQFDFGPAVPNGFVFSPDGRYLYGSSYYTGVSNVFRYDLAADSMDIVTNAETGFFRPIPGAGDSIVAFRYSGQGFVPCRIEARPLTDVSAITFLGERMVARHPVLRTWRIPPPSSIDLDTLQTAQGPYPGLGAVRLRNVYPVVEGYKDAAALGAHATFSDWIGLHQFEASATWSVDGGLPDDERLHLAVQYRRHDLSASARLNPASFYDLFGPKKASRKGYAAGLEWSRSLIRDAPRTLDLRVSANGYGGLEVLPDNQNVAAGPGFDKLFATQAMLSYKFLRQSIGAVDSEKGWSWRLGAWNNAVRFDRPGGGTWRGFPFALGTLDAGTPLPIRNSSLWLRTAAGVSPGERDEPFANFFFGGFGNNWVDRQEPKRYRDHDRFPGAGIDEIAGTNFARAMLDWNLPALRFRRAGTLAFYATWARLSVFGTGLVTNLDLDSGLRRTPVNAGALADVRFQLLTQQPLTLSFGYARAWERRRLLGDEWMVSLKVL